MTQDRSAEHGTPMFIVSTERSGSSVLRILMDSHSRICSPGELGLGRLIVDLSNAIHRTLGRAFDFGQPWEEDKFRFTQIRRIIDDFMEDYVKAKGKVAWCEKTPMNVMYLEQLMLTFPDAKFICLHRNCMDVVHSCLECSQDGFMPELQEYVVRNPGNFVGAMLDNWIDKTRIILDFEQRFPEQFHRLHYEDVVVAPQNTLCNLFEFLGMEWEPDIVTRAFRQAHDAGGGDPKLLYTTRLNPSHIGKGSAIPFASIDPPRLEVMNELLEWLDYLPVGPDWDHAPNPYLPGEADQYGAGVESVRDVFDRHVPARLEENSDSVGRMDIAVAFRITGSEAGCWTVDLRGEKPLIKADALHPVDLTVTMDTRVCIDVVSQNENPLEAYNKGEIELRGDLAHAEALRFFL